MDLNLEDNLVLVTGGTKGIGKAILLSLLEEGAKAVATYSVDDEAALKLNNEVDKLGFSNMCLIVKADASKKSDIEDLMQLVHSKWGSGFNNIVNNAAILKQGDFFQLSEGQWDRTFSVNLKGPFLICQKLMPEIEKLGGGSIVNIVSVGGQTGGPRATDYAASKAGLMCFTQSMSRIGSSMGIRVNAVSPGWIDTGIFTPQRYEEIKEEAKTKIPIGRLGEPQDVANAVLFLLSNKSSYITGHILNVNGGLYF